jgi:hypothetical protein
VLRRRPVVLCAAFAAASLVLAGCLPGAGRTFNGPEPARVIPFKGLGAWWDVWDWSPTFTGNRQALGLGDVDRLANAGVQTLYIQTATYRHPATVLDESLLRRIIARAHARGMKVVGWYLPQFLDTRTDVTRMSAMVGLGVDGIGIDIESTDNPNVADRTEKLLAEVKFLRMLHPDVPMAAIPVTPVIWEELNRGWWPRFPYRELSNYFDAWMPMAYWSYRKAGSFPEWGDPYRYTYESVVRLRTLTGRPELPVHPIGGEGTGMTPWDAARMAHAVADSSSIGGSVYDDRTTPANVYPVLVQMRRDQVK